MLDGDGSQFQHSKLEGDDANLALFILLEYESVDSGKIGSLWPVVLVHLEEFIVNEASLFGNKYIFGGDVL